MTTEQLQSLANADVCSDNDHFLLRLIAKQQLEMKIMSETIVQKDIIIEGLHQKCLQALGEPQNVQNAVEPVPSIQAAINALSNANPDALAVDRTGLGLLA